VNEDPPSNRDWDSGGTPRGVTHGLTWGSIPSTLNAPFALGFDGEIIARRRRSLTTATARLERSQGGRAVWLRLLSLEFGIVIWRIWRSSIFVS
jgi:hypothetical protein